jgi:hypothetical protein
MFEQPKANHTRFATPLGGTHLVAPLFPVVAKGIAATN